MEAGLLDAVIRKTLRVPAVTGPPGESGALARQLDAALVSAGFKLSKDLLEHVSGRDPAMVADVAGRVLSAVRELVGDHVEHNVYFRDFPANVPDTLEFWVQCIADALTDPRSSTTVSAQLSSGVVNLLDLPRYGRYQHTYEEMLAAHAELLPSMKDRLTLLHLGGPLAEEVRALYLALAGSTIPLSEDDLGLLREVAECCLDGTQPEVVPVRENRAVVNQVRLAADRPLLVDTVTDILRLACAMSDGDVTLQEPTRFRSFRRSERRRLLAALDEVVAASEAKLADVARHREPWKRLGERLHPHEHQRWRSAGEVFAVARGDRRVTSLAAQVEVAFARTDVAGAVALLTRAPGLLLRNLDRVLRSGSPAEVDTTLAVVGEVIGSVSGRVLLSLREHLQNRGRPESARVFANRRGRMWVAPDTREPLDATVVDRVLALLDSELVRRLPARGHLTVEPAVLSLAVPLSDKTTSDGFGIMPRGSVLPVATGLLRFFVHWKERRQTTDFDLSVLLLDDAFEMSGQVSWTNLGVVGGVHSGDITSAPAGASEFLDIDLTRVAARYVVPQVNVYSGEGFDEVEESFFGFMERAPDSAGQPFEARTVRMKSNLRGNGRVALPLVFVRDEQNRWTVKWLHLYLNGRPHFNRVEGHRLSTTMLVRSIVERDYLKMAYLVDLMRRGGRDVQPHSAEGHVSERATFIGIDRPDDAPDGTEVYTLARFSELTPA